MVTEAAPGDCRRAVVGGIRRDKRREAALGDWLPPAHRVAASCERFRRARPRSRPLYNRVEFRQNGWTVCGRGSSSEDWLNAKDELHHFAK